MFIYEVVSLYSKFSKWNKSHFKVYMCILNEVSFSDNSNRGQREGEWRGPEDLWGDSP